MNILILNWRDIKNEWAGGGEVYVFELAKRWVKIGHKVTLFCSQGIWQPLSSEEVIGGIHIYRRGGRYSIYFWAAWYYFTKFRRTTDIIVEVQNGTPFFSVLYSRKPKIAVVYHIHDRQFFIELWFPLNIIGYIIERYIFPLLYSRTNIMAISKTTKKELEKLGIPRKNIEIVYCGIDEKEPLGKGKKLSFPTILYLGRIKKYKRVSLLVKLMPKILSRVPSARLIIAGWGTEAATVMDMSMRGNNRKKVKIVGPVSEAEKKVLLSKVWVFVNPSIGEGWSISVIEANLHGTPAVAFNVPGLSESIRNGETGFLVENDSEFIDKICEILDNHILRKQLSENAIKWAKSFSWDRSAEESLRILERVRTN